MRTGASTACAGRRSGKTIRDQGKRFEDQHDTGPRFFLELLCLLPGIVRLAEICIISPAASVAHRIATLAEIDEAEIDEGSHSDPFRCAPPATGGAEKT